MLVSRVLATFFFIVHWSAAVVLGAAPEAKVDTDTIRVALPVYVVSIIATAGFVWTVARYEGKRRERLTAVENELRHIRRILTNIQSGHQ